MLPSKPTAAFSAPCASTARAPASHPCNHVRMNSRRRPNRHPGKCCSAVLDRMQGRNYAATAGLQPQAAPVRPSHAQKMWRPHPRTGGTSRRLVPPCKCVTFPVAAVERALQACFRRQALSKYHMNSVPHFHPRLPAKHHVPCTCRPWRPPVRYGGTHRPFSSTITHYF